MIENAERDHGVATPYTLTPFPSPSGRGEGGEGKELTRQPLVHQTSKKTLRSS